jgi:excisionase family DNA binding protein
MIYRTSNRRQNSDSKAAAHITGNTRVRPITKLRTIDETAELWDVSPRTVQRLIKTGALRPHRIGRLVRISEADAEDFLKQNRED